MAPMQGIWGGMIGGTFMQTLILLWVTFRTDWNKEVISKVTATKSRIEITSNSCMLFTLELRGSFVLHAGGRGQEEIEQVGGQEGTPSLLKVKAMLGHLLISADSVRSLALDRNGRGLHKR